jgi:hypothetical protein
MQRPWHTGPDPARVLTTPEVEMARILKLSLTYTVPLAETVRPEMVENMALLPLPSAWPCLMQPASWLTLPSWRMVDTHSRLATRREPSTAKPSKLL